jgi:hypothetical protein
LIEELERPGSGAMCGAERLALALHRRELGAIPLVGELCATRRAMMPVQLFGSKVAMTSSA